MMPHCSAPPTHPAQAGSLLGPSEKVAQPLAPGLDRRMWLLTDSLIQMDAVVNKLLPPRLLSPQLLGAFGCCS